MAACAPARCSVSIQDTNKRTINIDVPLLGFSLAFDKANKSRRPSLSGRLQEPSVAARSCS